MRRFDWNALDAAGRRVALARPSPEGRGAIAHEVRRIIEQVRADGDHTLRALTRRYDGAELAALEVGDQEIAAASEALPERLKQAMAEAGERIELFHRATAPVETSIETAPGVRCERLLRPIQRVGLYVPAGSAPLPSTALMLCVPARIAACPSVVLCTPPRSDGSCDPAVLHAARTCGVRTIFKLGGAQAIAALAYGTASVPRCDKIFGPGNAFVTEAKLQVAGDPDGAVIDMPAGPSEVLVVADAQADPRFVAADLLSQLEHGEDSQALLVSDDADLISRVLAELEVRLAALPRHEIATRAGMHARAILVSSLPQAFEVANAYAPEHLIVQVEDARGYLPQIVSAASVFLGPQAPEAIGDYCSGTNHVLPTAGYARSCSGVSVASFLKEMLVQELSADGLAAIGPCAMELARAEGLAAHERAIAIRLDAAGRGT